MNKVPLSELLRSKEAIFAIIVVMIVIMMVVPLPSAILSLFLTLNIATALIILLVSIYNQNALQFSAFPSLLLVATLFRLSLNVSTTRTILSGRGATIDIIKAFGNFVVGGNYVVGFVVFLILVLIQFIVITKGAERVAEVAARFTLDAMPIKGMAIDADLNAGAIDQEEATSRRLDLQREADFYGSMDGASKFVKNDAIAGIIITVINLLGGLVIGVFQRGESPMDAMAAYALFTVGDGLVSQIPALLIATATGIVVTRASSDSSMGEQVGEQVFSNPKVLGIGSAMLTFLGLIPGLPKFSFLFLAVVFGSMAYLTQKNEEEVSAKTAEEKQAEEEGAQAGPEDVTSLLSIDTLELEIGYNLIPLVDANQGGDLLNRITLIRRQIALDLGLVVPAIRIRDNIQLQPSTYVFKIKGVEYDSYEIIADQFMAMNPGTATGKISGIEVVEPAFGLPAVWIQDTLRERAEMSGYTVVDPSTVIATHVTELIRKNAHEILGRQELQQLLDTVKENYPLVVAEVVPNIVSETSLLKILQNLLKENVSIRHLVTILESLADCKGVAEVDILTEYSRQGLCRHICKALLDESGILRVISLDPQLEQMLGNALQKIEGTVQLGIDPKSAQKLLEAMKTQFDNVMQEGITPILLCSSALRLSLKRLTERIAPRLTVLSYQEIPPSIQLESIGLVSLNG
jgi:flagellar biosynthesis protein FlhA